MKGICISHRPYLIKNSSIDNKERRKKCMCVRNGGCFLISTRCWLLKVSFILEKDTGSLLEALMATEGVNCTCILDKAEQGDDRSCGLI